MEQLAIDWIRHRVTLPLYRADCEVWQREREAGKSCPHLNCRHNLIGEMARMPEGEAVKLAKLRLLGKVTDSCALDVADREPGDREIARLLGLRMEALEEVSEEALDAVWVVLETS